jgi:FeS assembly SUF system protein
MREIPIVQPPAQPSASSSQPQTAGMAEDAERSAALKPLVVKALSSVYDPEIPVNIYELGLIYDIVIDAAGAVGIRMTLTAPGCPAAQILPEQVKTAVAAVPGVSDAKVDVVWDPPWDRDRMSDAAKLQLGMF